MDAKRQPRRNSPTSVSKNQWLVPEELESENPTKHQAGKVGALTDVTVVKLVPLTPRASALGDGVVLTATEADVLRRFIAFFTNFAEKGSDEVHVKCHASADRLVFRIVNGAWSFHGLAPVAGQTESRKVDASAAQFELYALLLKRNEARLEEKSSKPSVIRRGEKNRESSVKPPEPARVPLLEETAAAESAAKAVEFADQRLPTRHDLVPFQGSHPVAGDVRTFVTREEASRRLDLWFDLLRGALPVTAATSVYTPAPAIDVEAKPVATEPATPPLKIEYHVVKKPELAGLLLGLLDRANAPGRRGNVHMVEVVDAMAAGNCDGKLHVPYNGDIYDSYRDLALKYIPLQVKAIIEQRTGKILDWKKDDVTVGTDERGQHITASLNHYFLKEKTTKV